MKSTIWWEYLYLRPLLIGGDSGVHPAGGISLPITQPVGNYFKIGLNNELLDSVGTIVLLHMVLGLQVGELR